MIEYANKTTVPYSRLSAGDEGRDGGEGSTVWYNAINIEKNKLESESIEISTC